MHKDSRQDAHARWLYTYPNSGGLYRSKGVGYCLCYLCMGSPEPQLGNVAIVPTLFYVELPTEGDRWAA
jgi:hypothetical protein